jgi:hypothetical protein
MRRTLDSRGWHGIRIDRCVHETVHVFAGRMYDPDGKQIGVVALTDPLEDSYRANRMLNGMPTSERHFASMPQAVEHIMYGRK